MTVGATTSKLLTLLTILWNVVYTAYNIWIINTEWIHITYTDTSEYDKLNTSFYLAYINVNQINYVLFCIKPVQCRRMISIIRIKITWTRHCTGIKFTFVKTFLKFIQILHIFGMIIQKWFQLVSLRNRVFHNLRQIQIYKLTNLIIAIK